MMWVLLLFAGLLDLALCVSSLGTFDAVLFAIGGLCLCTAAALAARRTVR